VGQTLRLLQVEDSPNDAELIQRALTQGGYALDSLRVETPAALEQALRSRTWDLVLSDHLLPGFGGGEALRLVQASELNLPFIIVSGAIGEETAVAAMKAGAHDYIFKGNLARLCPAIERELKEARTRERQLDAERALRASEQRYRALFEHSPMPTWVLDFSEVKGLLEAHGVAGSQDLRTFLEHPGALQLCAQRVRVVDVNQRSLDFSGTLRKEDISRNLMDYFVEGSWPSYLEVLVTLASGGRALDCEMPIRGTRGEVSCISMHLSVSPGFEDSWENVLVSFSDISPRIEMEASLLKAQALLERAQGLAHIGSWEWIPSQNVLRWSSELFRIFGLEPTGYSPSYDDFVGMIHAEDRAMVLGTLEVVVATGESMALDYRIIRSDGEIRHVQELAEAVPGVPPTLRGTIQDDTERRQFEAVRKEMGKLSAKGRMAAYIAHEINNPLAGIKNAFSLLEGAIPADHPYFRYTGLIQREIDRIAGIIRTMYSVYRPQTDLVVEVPLLEACQDIRNLLAPSSSRVGVDILVDPAHRGLVVLINPGLLRQLLFNLVQNAVEASPPDGVVTLRLARLPGEIQILVEDMGEGIPPELERQIFEADFTTKLDSDMSGLGLGLSACRNIVESIGGSLNFGPLAQGKGTQFRVCLPETLIFTASQDTSDAFRGNGRLDG